MLLKDNMTRYFIVLQKYHWERRKLRLPRQNNTFLYAQSKNLQFDKTYLHERHHWDHDKHGYP